LQRASAESLNVLKDEISITLGIYALVTKKGSFEPAQKTTHFKTSWPSSYAKTVAPIIYVIKK
jgi:hypothetical protein